MEYRKTKLIIAFGFLVAFIIFLAAPTFAFEGFEVECTPYCTSTYNPPTYFQFIDPDYPDSAYYSPVGSQAEEIGLITSFPVPYYADGDHYSIFMNFSIGVPYSSVTAGNWLGLYIKPQYSIQNGSMGTTTGGTYIRTNITTLTPNNNPSTIWTGSFTWSSKVSCSYKILVTCLVDAEVATGNQTWIYNFTCVFDLNLQGGTGVLADELHPFAISAKYYTGYPNNQTTDYGLALGKRFSCRCTDTSLYGLLEDIQTAVAQIDFSGLSGLASLSTTVENFYTTYSTQTAIEIGVLESMLDDGETDAEPLQWESQAQEMQSQVEELHSLEEDIKGTFTDYEFPTAPNQTAIGNVANMFFQNELFIALTLAFFTMTLCMMFLF